MFKKKGKKGISPLIATVLLVGFVVVIASLIFFWGKSYIMETAQKEGELSKFKMLCNDVNFDVVNFDGSELELENKGSVDLVGFKLRAENLDTIDIKKILKSYEQDRFTIPNGVGNEFDLIPLLQPEGKGAPLVPCSNKIKKINTN